MLSIRARAARALIRTGARSSRELSIEQRRARVDRLAGRIGPPRGTSVRPLEPTAGAPGLRGEWVRARQSRDDRVVLYLHGGAFCMGSPLSHRGLVARICAAAQATALSLDYSLAPERPFPAALEDIRAAYRFLLDEGLAAHRIAFAGDSAGANLVLASIILLRDAAEPLPAAAVCISPPTDFTGASGSLVSRARLDPLVNVDAMTPLCRAYAHGASPDDPRISPLLADLAGLPPLLLQVGSNEVLYDDSVRFADKARTAGVDVRLEVGSQLWHVWHATAPYVPEARRAIARIGAFIREHIPAEDAPRDRSAA